MIKDIKASSQLEHSNYLSAAFIYQLLKDSALINPHNATYSEFKKILLEGYDRETGQSTIVVQTKNPLDQGIRTAIHQGLDLRVQFELFRGMSFNNIITLDRPRFKKLLLKNKLYTNENDMSSLMFLIYKNRD